MTEHPFTPAPQSPAEILAAFEATLRRRCKRSLRWHPARGWQRLVSDDADRVSWVTDAAAAAAIIDRIADGVGVPPSLRRAMSFVAIRVLRDATLISTGREVRRPHARRAAIARNRRGPGDAA